MSILFQRNSYVMEINQFDYAGNEWKQKIQPEIMLFCIWGRSKNTWHSTGAEGGQEDADVSQRVEGSVYLDTFLISYFYI